MVRKALTWWYHRKIYKDEVKLKELRKQRKKILDEVMETETYKVAKEILEKYAPEQLVTRPVGAQTVTAFEVMRKGTSLIKVNLYYFAVRQESPGWSTKTRGHSG